MDYEELKGKKLKDEELTKLYVNTLQVYDDQLSIMELIITKSAESRKVLVDLEKLMIERGFQIVKEPEDLDESVTS